MPSSFQSHSWVIWELDFQLEAIEVGTLDVWSKIFTLRKKLGFGVHPSCNPGTEFISLMCLSFSNLLCCISCHSEYKNLSTMWPFIQCIFEERESQNPPISFWHHFLSHLSDITSTFYIFKSHFLSCDVFSYSLYILNYWHFYFFCFFICC